MVSWRRSRGRTARAPMRKLGIAMVLLPVLAGCAASSTDGPSRPGPVPGAARPDVEWHTARVGDEIVVELIDRQRPRIRRRRRRVRRRLWRRRPRRFGTRLQHSADGPAPRGDDHADDGAPQAARRLPTQGRGVGHKNRSDRPGGNRAFRRHRAALSGQTRSISTPSDRILIWNSGNADLGKIGMTRPWSLNFGVTTITASSADGGSPRSTRFTQTSP